MRVIYITAGAAGSYCGACARDATLVRSLRARGHDIELVPLYTPVRVDGPDPSIDRVFLGGVNVYLDEHLSLHRRTPQFIRRALDSKPLLKLASRFAVRTRPEQLGEMTVSVLRGANGRQKMELDRLLDYLEQGERPQVVNLTNALLSGLAPVIRERLSVPVLCTLQGEDDFLRSLPSPHREEAHQLLRENVRHVRAFIAPAKAYADEMAEFLSVDPGDIRVVRAGIDLAMYGDLARSERGAAFRIGFLARVCRAKGLDLVCEAFRLLEERSPGNHVLMIAGQTEPAERELWPDMHDQLRRAGLADRILYRGELSFDEKMGFLAQCDVLCAPVRRPEPRAITCLEAMAGGVPVIASDVGVFPEIAELTDGLLRVPPNDPVALAEAVTALRDDRARLRDMGRHAAEAVAEQFSASQMADETVAVYEQVLEP